jgi:mannose-6-phosphate isomerase-like protein (cupin superfamily)
VLCEHRLTRDAVRPARRYRENSVSEQHPYEIRRDVKYGYNTLVDVPAIVRECTAEWFNQSLCEVNDCVVRLAVVRGEFHWHKHDEEDEFFFVLSGKLLLDLEEQTIELGPQPRTIELGPHQGYAVPKAVTHRTRAPERTVMLVFEKSSVEPTGD